MSFHTTTEEDLAYVAWAEQNLDGYEDYVEKENQRAYDAWAEDRRADGEDASEDAYLEYLEGFLPDD